MNDNDTILVIKESISNVELWKNKIKECNGELKKAWKKTNKMHKVVP